MASTRDHDEEVVITFRGRTSRIPIHWRTDAEIQRRFGGGMEVDGYVNPVSGDVWVSHESNKRKTLDHELEHALTEWRQKVWNGE